MGAEGVISIHAPLAGCDMYSSVHETEINISIHAPLAGCDALRYRSAPGFPPISIHAPLAGCDTIALIRPLVGFHFNPRTPCGVRPSISLSMANASSISIHAPLAGCDATSVSSVVTRVEFQSTHPLRGATRRSGQDYLQMPFQSTHPLRGATAAATSLFPALTISIHAPLAGCDLLERL